MMNFLRKHKRIIFIVTITTFIGSFIPNLFYSENYIAKVNGVKIPLRTLNSVTILHLQSIKKMKNKQITEKDLNEIQTRLTKFLVDKEILYQQSKLYGIVVSNEELKTYLQGLEVFKNNNTFNKQKYYSVLKFVQMTPKEYETILRKQICENKLKTILASSVKLWNYELKNSPKQNSATIKNSLVQKKINIILNDWYSNIVRNSKIKTINKKSSRH
ncbi:MAG: SurA N-terminal domain-containing protein [Endomicrobium sp.]|nr:SurA N-terminal domain-containing protein [Endomicrobium sp.]